MNLLADRILYQKNWGHIQVRDSAYDLMNKNVLQPITKGIYGSKIVVLDDPTAELAYQLSLTLQPAQIIESLQYFRLPSPRMWFEFRRDAFLPETPPGTTGFLLERFGEDGFSISLVDEEVRTGGNVITGSLIKFYFSINADEIAALGNPLKLSFRQKTFFALGMQYEPGTDLDRIFKDIANLSAQTEMVGNGFDDDWHRASEHFEFSSSLQDLRQYPGYANMLQQYVEELAGTTRHVLALLMLYHFPPVEHYERKSKKGRRVINGQSRPFFSFEEVKVRIPRRKPTNPYKWVRNGLPKVETRKRAHEVDGHWRCVRPLTVAEINALDKPVSQLTDRERYKYTWVKSHQRGDATIGFVRKTKLLTSR